MSGNFKKFFKSKIQKFSIVDSSRGTMSWLTGCTVYVANYETKNENHLAVGIRALPSTRIELGCGGRWLATRQDQRGSREVAQAE